MTTPEPFPSNPYPSGSYPDAVPPVKKLRRSSNDKMIAGICGGLATYFGVDATWIRVAFVASILLPGPQVLLYLLLWLIIPQD
ncbi:MAG: PspC domain-containing protein [Gordonia sp. (in: high G+C Gram-positive bacteria)]|uniref:PspC domain-containing protein n=1 Tax=Gordonia sp. (in: high G+C Gram-positive bacteria) TaxID=84139 RepID=UPI003BB4D471